MRLAKTTTVLSFVNSPPCQLGLVTKGQIIREEQAGAEHGQAQVEI